MINLCRVLFLVTTAALVYAGCDGGARGTSLQAGGTTSLAVVPTVQSIEGRGVGGDLVGSLLAAEIVPISIDDVPVVIHATVDATTVTIDEVCVEIDLCSFYNDNELGAARAAVGDVFTLTAFASTFGGTLSVPFSTENGTEVVEISAAPKRFNSLQPVEACPKPFCSAQRAKLEGDHLNVSEAWFDGEIIVEIDLNNGNNYLGGATVIGSVSGAAPFDSLRVDSEGVDLVDLPLPLDGTL
ncbi:MAG: hypothetical protein R3A47_02560 [Polyangiales bacterium]